MLFNIVMIIGMVYGIFILFLPIIIWIQQKKLWELEEQLKRQSNIIKLLSNDKYKKYKGDGDNNDE